MNNNISSLVIIKLDLRRNIFITTSASPESPLSLERLANVQIAISLWNRGDIRYRIVRLYTSRRRRNVPLGLEIIINEVIKRISQIIPPSIREPLKIMIGIIGQQIACFLNSSSVFDFKPAVLRVLVDNICWTYQGTINSLETARRIARSPRLSEQNRIIIACDSCSKSLIFELFSEFSAQVRPMINNVRNPGIVSLELLWIYRLRDDESVAAVMDSILGRRRCRHRRRRRRRRSEIIIRKLFEWAIEKEIGTIVYFLWENLSKILLKSRNLVEWTVYTYSHSICSTSSLNYLLAQMDQVKLRDLCLQKFEVILHVVLDDWRLHDIFLPTVTYIASVNPNTGLWNVLEVLQRRKHKLCKYKVYHILNELFIIFWNRIELKLWNKRFLRYFLYSVGYTKTMNLILSKANFYFEESLFFKILNLQLCESLTIDFDLDILNRVLKEIFDNPRMFFIPNFEISLYKRILFTQKPFDTCKYLIIEGRYEMLNEILQVMQREDIKQELPYMNQGAIVSALIKLLDGAQWEITREVIDNFLDWSFQGNDDALTRCRTWLVGNGIFLQRN